MTNGNLRLILGGGGDAADSVAIDRIFADWTRAAGAGAMLFLPVAMDGTRASYADCHAWARSVFEPLGMSDVEMRTDLAAIDDAALARFDSVYIGGGNTFRLLDLARRTGVGDRLRRYALRGGPVYGGSAGAILLGHDIATCAHMDTNDVGLTDTRGLDLAGGFSAWCHYTPADDARMAAYRRSYPEPILAIPERAGVVIEAGRARAEGTAPVVIVDGRGRRLVQSRGRPFD